MSVLLQYVFSYINSLAAHNSWLLVPVLLANKRHPCSLLLAQAPNQLLFKLLCTHTYCQFIKHSAEPFFILKHKFTHVFIAIEVVPKAHHLSELQVVVKLG